MKKYFLLSLLSLSVVHANQNQECKAQKEEKETPWHLSYIKTCSAAALYGAIVGTIGCIASEAYFSVLQGELDSVTKKINREYYQTRNKENTYQCYNGTTCNDLQKYKEELENVLQRKQISQNKMYTLAVLGTTVIFATGGGVFVTLNKGVRALKNELNYALGKKRTKDQ